MRAGLPAGVEIVPAYDRSQLIREAVATLRRTLIEEMLVVSLVIFVFLLHARSALIPILTIPVGVTLAFVPMLEQGLTANIMSLGGIAVAIGAMVDAAIIVVENVHKRLEAWEEAGRAGPREAVILAAMQEVAPSVFFALLVITVSFLPIFSLEGTEGRLFKPLAFTKTYAMGFAAVLSVTLTPALAALLIRGRIRGEHANPLNRWLVRAYTPIVRVVVRRRRRVIAAALLIVASAVPVFLRLGSEFMPPLNEGTLLYMPTGPPGISVAEASRVLQLMDRELKRFPEVERVFGKIGRAESATDPAPLSMVETVVTLAPRERWRAGLTWDGLIAELNSGAGVPRHAEPVVDADPDAHRDARDRRAQPARHQSVWRGSRERRVGGRRNRERAARRPRHPQCVRRADHRGLLPRHPRRPHGGGALRPLGRGRERGDRVRDRRHDGFAHDRGPRALRRSGALRARVPRRSRGHRARCWWRHPAARRFRFRRWRRSSSRRDPTCCAARTGGWSGLVAVDVAGRALVDYVAEAKRMVSERVTLPPGTRLGWAGQFEYFERAKQRLQVVLPITLALVMLLLYLNTGSGVETAIVMLAVPFSLVGAVWLLWLLDYNLSVAVWVGIIALAGLDAQTGVVMLLYLTLAHRERRAAGRLRTPADLEDAIVEGAARRIRPKLMTVRHHDPRADAAALERRHGRGRDEAYRSADGGRARDFVPARVAGLPRALRRLEEPRTPGRARLTHALCGSK